MGSIHEAISAYDDKYMAAFNAGDAAAVAALYTEQGQILPSHADFVTGREAIQAFEQSGMDMGLASMQIETREVEQHDDTAIQVGTYTLHAQDGTELDTGKFVVIFKRVEGEWKAHRDIFNSSKPAPA